MSKAEVIRRLKSHLQHQINRKGTISYKDDYYCLNYIMDFLRCDRKTAREIYKNEIMSAFNVSE